MPDINHQWGSDLASSATGDLMTVDGTSLGVQRVLRRLLTTQLDYIWHTDYGAGLPGRVGELLDLPFLSSLIRSQIFLEAAVARTPEPTISVVPIPNGVFVRVAYVDAQTGQQINLAFDVT